MMLTLKRTDARPEQRDSVQPSEACGLRAQAEFNLSVTVKYASGTNNRFYPTVTCGSLGSTSNRFNFEQGDATHFHIKADRGGWTSTAHYLYNATITAITTNVTTNRSMACIGNTCTSWETYTRDAGAEDCDAMSFGSIQGGAFQIYNVLVYQDLKPYDTTSNGTTGLGTVTILERNTYTPFGSITSGGTLSKKGYEGKEADFLVGDTDAPSSSTIPLEDRQRTRTRSRCFTCDRATALCLDGKTLRERLVRWLWTVRSVK